MPKIEIEQNIIKNIKIYHKFILERIVFHTNEKFIDEEIVKYFFKILECLNDEVSLKGLTPVSRDLIELIINLKEILLLIINEIENKNHIEIDYYSDYFFILLNCISDWNKFKYIVNYPLFISGNILIKKFNFEKDNYELDLSGGN